MLVCCPEMLHLALPAYYMAYFLVGCPVLKGKMLEVLPSYLYSVANQLANFPASLYQSPTSILTPLLFCSFHRAKFSHLWKWRGGLLIWGDKPAWMRCSDSLRPLLPFVMSFLDQEITLIQLVSMQFK